MVIATNPSFDWFSNEFCGQNMICLINSKLTEKEIMSEKKCKSGKNIRVRKSQINCVKTLVNRVIHSLSEST